MLGKITALRWCNQFQARIDLATYFGKTGEHGMRMNRLGNPHSQVGAKRRIGYLPPRPEHHAGHQPELDHPGKRALGTSQPVSAITRIAALTCKSYSESSPTSSKWSRSGTVRA